MKRKFFWAAGILLGIGVVALVGLFTYVGVINHLIDERMEQLHTAKSSRFYAFYPPLQVKQQFTRKELRTFLEDQGYREKRNADDILPGEYAWESPTSLMLFRPAFNGAGHPQDKTQAQVTFAERDAKVEVQSIVRVDTGAPVDSFESMPKQIGAFLAGRLRTQDSITLSEMPVSIRYAVMGIEDANFLEHHGVSFRSTVRALLRNIESGRKAQGGSTITQQLMKNLFFSSERVLSRKVKEAIFAFVTEMRHSKESILEAYLNEVYLGQWSTHEIHGVAEGARYYFNRSISELSLAQSATLAALIQAPNAHDPRKYPDRAIKRRNLVIQKMKEAGFILPDEAEMALAEPLGVVPTERSLENVDYFIDLVMDHLAPSIRKALDSGVLTIYVTLNPFLQSLGAKVLNDNVDRLQKTYPALQALAKKGHQLQGALLAINPRNCTVLAVQGGKSYRQTQFNRVTQGKRQPGSLFKPFVYLAAFANPPKDGPITAISEIEDYPFEWKYENQIWKPKNYDNSYRGLVTARRALEDSLNIPTARVAQRAGVPAIVDTLRKAGIQSPFPAVPSLSLGSADVTPLELAEAYTTLANEGKGCSLRPYFEVFDENKNLIQENKMVLEDRLPAGPTFLVDHILKGTFTHGTARSAVWSGIKLNNFAGKTGTTNDAKDAWFIGYSPDLLVLVWVGYDEEEKVGLTGSAAALPIWTDFIKNAGPFVLPYDFQPPEGMVPCLASHPAKDAPPGEPAVDVQLEYFLPGTQPKDCTMNPSQIAKPQAQ